MRVIALAVGDLKASRVVDVACTQNSPARRTTLIRGSGHIVMPLVLVEAEEQH